MQGRIAFVTLLGVLALAPAAHAEDFALQHQTSGVIDARAEGDVTFPDAGGAVINITVTDAAEDGWCGDAWVRSNLPPSTHVKYQVCNVGKQQTYTLTLPAVSRCDVTFVDVQVGRVDPSNGDKTEMGDSRRIANPCPPPPEPVVAPVPAPPPPPAAIDAHIKHDWTAWPRYSRNETLLVTGVPAGAAVELRCHGTGCPAKRRTIPVRNGTADAHRVLRGRHRRVGATLELRVTRADMIGKAMKFKIRRGRTPATQTLCMPIGVATAKRC